METPVSTYRLQLNRQFRFADAQALVPYLKELGAGHLYVSPILAARRGSSHGYDGVDPTRVNPELGGERPFRALARELARAGMGLLVDIVPNHMAASHENPWWWDVLKSGRDSAWAGLFDIDWRPPEPELRGKVLLPVLGDSLDAVLGRGEIRLARARDGLVARYFAHRFPIFGRGGAMPRSAGGLARLLAAQHYRLAFWRRGDAGLNYRRFFNVSELVCLRMEKRRTFEAAHAYLARLAESMGGFDLRVDHIDGLQDPSAYLRALGERFGADRYVVVEKILGRGERLPADWPVAGTTGYDFLNELNGLFVDRRGMQRLERIRARFTVDGTAFEDAAYAGKKRVLEMHFRGELRALGGRLRDPEWTAALGEVTACLPVYRTYIRPGLIGAQDRRAIRQAVREARRRGPSLRPAALRGVEEALLAPEAELATHWQKFTSSVMAKGVEDTAFYRHSALISANEVGGDPGSPAIVPEELHRRLRSRRRRAPMNATSTHDTKRGEDARARINVLSEVPEEWEAHLSRWRRWNEPHRREVWGRLVPDRQEELFLYQTLLGAWPATARDRDGFRGRLKDYLIKAAREAKLSTSWVEVDPDHEAALLGFADAILRASPRNRFLPSFLRLQARMARAGALNSLAQVAVKAVAPGVPDFYQGTELWDLSLVDPDNRRPVDFARRRRMLAGLRRRRPKDLAPDLAADWADGRVKLFLTWKALSLRRERALRPGGGDRATAPQRLRVRPPAEGRLGAGRGSPAGGRSPGPGGSAVQAGRVGRRSTAAPGGGALGLAERPDRRDAGGRAVGEEERAAAPRRLPSVPGRATRYAGSGRRLKQTTFGSVISWSAKRIPSRPSPEPLTPPNGIASRR